MRRGLLLGLTVLLAVTTARSRAQDGEKKAEAVAMVATGTLPFHPFGRARVGDWSVRIVRATRGDEAARVHARYDKVIALEGKQVTVASGWFDAEGRSDERVKVHAIDDLSVQGSFLQDVAGDSLSSSKVSAKETVEVVSKREWRGYVLSYHYSACKQSWDETKFLCADVPGAVVVSRIQVTVLGKPADTIEVVLAGFGNDEKVLFGDSLEDVKRSLTKR
jgi:hypothetical protein